MGSVVCSGEQQKYRWTGNEGANHHILHADTVCKRETRSLYLRGWDRVCDGKWENDGSSDAIVRMKWFGIVESRRNTEALHAKFAQEIAHCASSFSLLSTVMKNMEIHSGMQRVRFIANPDQGTLGGRIINLCCLDQQSR